MIHILLKSIAMKIGQTAAGDVLILVVGANSSSDRTRLVSLGHPSDENSRNKPRQAIIPADKQTASNNNFTRSHDILRRKATINHNLSAVIRILDRVIRRFLGNRDVVWMAFGHAGGRDPAEPGVPP